MEFTFFHLTPYAETKNQYDRFPVTNKEFEPHTGKKLYETYLTELQEAEKAGFNSIAVNEHHMSPYGLMANPNLVASILSQQTEKASIAVLGNLIPLLNPVRVAEEYAMIDVLSGGRLIAGFMRGTPHEYMSYNIPFEQSWSRFEEAYELIIRCWTEPEPFGWEGEHFQFEEIAIWPRPYVQNPHPPVLMSGSSERSVRFAAKKRARIGIVRVSSLEQVKSLIDLYKQIAHEDGWEPTPDYFLVGFHTAIASTDEEAKEILARAETEFYTVLSKPQQKMSELITGQTATTELPSIEQRIEEHTVICGSPETVIRQLNEIKEVTGVESFSLNFKIASITHKEVMHGLKLFKEQVKPYVVGRRD